MAAKMRDISPHSKYYFHYHNQRRVSVGGLVYLTSFGYALTIECQFLVI